MSEVKQTIIAIRTQTPNGTQKANMELERIEWRVLHVSVNDETRLKLLNALKNNKSIYIPFRKWELYELPSMRTAKIDYMVCEVQH